MANEWIYSSGSACYDSGTAGFALAQNGVFDLGKLYVVEFTISGMTQGKLILDGIWGQSEYTEDGDYQALGIATNENLVFIGEEYLGAVFDGCIDVAQARLIPLYTIKDRDGIVIFEQTDETGVTASGNNIQYEIDWSDLEDGCYKIWITDGVIDYVSDEIRLAESHPCTIKLTWNNDEDAYGFDYSDLNFTQTLRVKAKKWHPNYPKEKNVFKDNSGARRILKSETTKEELLTVSEMPQYCHDALAIGLEHDNFYIDGEEYTNEETEYTPKWRKSSQLAPVEVVVIKDQNLKNSNC